MARDKINGKMTDIDSVQIKHCSTCHEEILPGQFYVRDIISNEITCSNCDDGQAPIKGDVLISID